MRGLMLFTILICSLNLCAKGYLGKHGVFTFNATEYLQQKKINLEYTQLISRRFGFGIYYGRVSYSAQFNSASAFSYLVQNSHNLDNEITFDGSELFLRFVKGSKFENNVVPLGLSIDFGLGATYYSVKEMYTLSNIEVNRSNRRFSVIYDMGVKKTVNLYKAINFFAKIHGGIISTLYNPSLTEGSGDALFYALPKRGLNMYYVTKNQGFIRRVYFNIHVGLSFLI